MILVKIHYAIPLGSGRPATQRYTVRAVEWEAAYQAALNAFGKDFHLRHITTIELDLIPADHLDSDPSATDDSSTSQPAAIAEHQVKQLLDLGQNITQIAEFFGTTKWSIMRWFPQLIREVDLPVGRPSKSIDAAEVAVLATHGRSTEEIAAYFELSKDTVERRFAEALSIAHFHRKILLADKPVETTPATKTFQALDLSKLTDKQLKDLTSQLRRIMARRDPDGGASDNAP